ncbi:MAG: BON domain-containing protein [Pirellulaceae bacterium]
MSHIIRFAIIATMLSLPTITVAGDTEIAEQIVSSLNERKSEGSLKGFNIGLRVEEGVVWLDGHVASGDQHDLAVDIARRVEGVQRVIDGIQVETVRSTDTLKTLKTETLETEAPETLEPFTEQPEPVKLESVSAKSIQQDEMEFAVEPAALLPASLANVGSESRSVLVNHDESAADTMRPIRPATQPAQGSAAGRSGGSQRPLAMSAAGSNAYPQHRMVGMAKQGGAMMPAQPAYYPPTMQAMPVRYDQPHMPGYAWPAYAAHPNYAAVTYPKQYSPAAWPYIGPFYPYPQVPLGWRKVTMQWDKGWWTVDFRAR